MSDTANIAFVGVDEHWNCPICGQKLEVGVFGCILYPEKLRHCALREYAGGGECVAFRSPERARRLMAVKAERQSSSETV